MTAPTCRWAVGPSWARNPASTAVSLSPCAWGIVSLRLRCGEGIASEDRRGQARDDRHEQHAGDHRLERPAAAQGAEQPTPPAPPPRGEDQQRREGEAGARRGGRRGGPARGGGPGGGGAAAGGGGPGGWGARPP